MRTGRVIIVGAAAALAGVAVSRGLGADVVVTRDDDLRLPPARLSASDQARRDEQEASRRQAGQAARVLTDADHRRLARAARIRELKGAKRRRQMS